ncbi:MAG: deoxynucleoside kinase [Nitrosospira sp. 56-18]|nr:deoxynucleoside kinase [Nitrosospira sp.]OJY14545.1 MAG: deoxynucleoside kinase [Nitrosospira sp. 56-18]
MKLEDCRYVVIEGPIGAGKTSLARRMAVHLSGQTLLEKPEENPFLDRFYGDMPRHALQTQLFFLFQRINQLQGLTQMDMFASTIVSDFFLDKDPLFARLTLSDSEYDLYKKIFHQLQTRQRPPDLVIYLQASVPTLMGRVKRRGSPFEKNISEDYLRQVADSYARFFHQYEDAPLMIINSENLNLVDNPGNFRLLLERVNAMRSRREYFDQGV